MAEDRTQETMPLSVTVQAWGETRAEMADALEIAASVLRDVDAIEVASRPRVIAAETFFWHYRITELRRDTRKLVASALAREGYWPPTIGRNYPKGLTARIAAECGCSPSRVKDIASQARQKAWSEECDARERKRAEE